jgi:hypothetical protein
MSSFFEKRKVAQEEIESGNLSLRENPLGEMVEEKPYHKMYSNGFPGYFTYIVLCDYGSLDSNRQHTGWGFDYYDHYEDYSPYYREPPVDYEYCLSTTELVPWLDKYYGGLTSVEDYQYLLDILEAAHNSTGEIHLHAELNKARALKWLNMKIEQLVSLPASYNDLAIRWNVSRAQLVELVYALSLAGVITSTKPGGIEGMVERLGKALGIEATSSVSVVVNSIKNKRSDKRRTPLLTKILDVYTKWLNEEK